ncbi:Bifunctional protein GlmU [Asimina triloba]
MGGSDSGGGSLWLAQNPSKRWGELFFLLYTPFWLTLCLGIVVPYKLYESFTELEYLLLGLVSAVPSFLIPLLMVGKVTTAMYVILVCVIFVVDCIMLLWLKL